MKTLLLLIFTPKKGALNFQNRYRDDLYKEGMFLAFLYAIIFSFNSIFQPSESLILSILGQIISLCLWLLTCMILSFIIYKIGAWLNGNSNYKETFTLLMYAFFPIFFSRLIVEFLINPDIRNYEFNTPTVRNCIVILSWIISLRMLLIGFIKIYQINFTKALIVISPILFIFCFLFYPLIHYYLTN